MKIGGPPLQALVSNTQVSRDLQREAVQVVREQEKVRQREPAPGTFDADGQLGDAARRPAQHSGQQQQVMASERAASTQRGYQYYPLPDRSGLSASQQRALQTYSNNQQLSRTVIDGNSEFLGSVDVFA